MSKEIEKLLKIQSKLNGGRFHLCIQTNLEDDYKWALIQYFPNTDDYFSNFNAPIMESSVDTLDELISYLKKHNGFKIEW